MKLRDQATGTTFDAGAARGEVPRGARLVRDGRRVWVHHRGETYRIEKVLDRPGGAGEEEHDLRAPMPGTIARLLVAEGARVARGEPLLVLSAMKMEHEVRAPAAGTVLRVIRAAGESVQIGDPLLEIG
jgi:biotin carboxyl carrier protein